MHIFEVPLEKGEINSFLLMSCIAQCLEIKSHSKISWFECYIKQNNVDWKLLDSWKQVIQ